MGTEVSFRLSITTAAVVGPGLAFAAAWFSRFCGLQRVTPWPPHSDAAATSTDAVVVENPYGLIAHDCFGPSYRDDLLCIFALIVLPFVLGLLLRPSERPRFAVASLLGALSAVTYAVCMCLLRGRSNDSAVAFGAMIAVAIVIGGLAAVLGAWISSRARPDDLLERRRGS